MIHKIILPKLGTNMDKAKIVLWTKKENDRVSKGDILVEVETDKAVFQVESENAGYLRKILFKEGENVSITKTIAIVSDSMSDDIQEIITEINDEVSGSSLHLNNAYSDWLDNVGSSVTGNMKSVNMSPAARKLATEKNLNFSLLTEYFSGKKNILEAKDIDEFIASFKKEKVVIYGAGLGAKQALEIINNRNDIEVIGFIDDASELLKKQISGYKVLGGFDYLKKEALSGNIKNVVLSFHSEVRKKVFERIKNEIPGLKIKTLIDPRAVISKDIGIGEGVFIEAGVVIGPGVSLGNAVIVDLGVTICHDCFIGDFTHLSPGSVLSGVVCIKENVLVGVGASVNSTVTIGENVIITPGSAVMNNVVDNVIVNGIPAMVIGESKRGAR